MISYHFLNQTSRNNFFTNDTAHGAGQLWSHIPKIPAYQQFQTPFPIVVSDSRPVGSNLTTTLSLDPVVYEVRLSTQPLTKPNTCTDNPSRVRLVRPQSLRGDEPHLRRHPPVQWQARERLRLRHWVRSGRLHYGYQRQPLQCKPFLVVPAHALIHSP